MSGRQAYDISVEVSGPNSGMLLHSYIGLFQKNIVSPLVEDIDFFEVDLPGFPVKFTENPLEFPFFALTPPPGNS